jgi:hypothetical protein
MKISIDTIVKNMNKNFKKNIFSTKLKNVIIKNPLENQLSHLIDLDSDYDFTIKVYFANVDNYKKIINSFDFPEEIYENELIILKTIKLPIISISNINLVEKYFNIEIMDIYTVNKYNLYFSLLYELFQFFKV